MDKAFDASIDDISTRATWQDINKYTEEKEQERERRGKGAERGGQKERGGKTSRAPTHQRTLRRT